MSLFIDAYNVLHCSYVLPDAYAMITAPQLGQLIDRTGFYRGRVVIVCDGRPKPDEDMSLDLGAVELVHSGAGADADTIIERLVEADTAPREIVVVSNDNRLRRAARRRGGTFQSSERFLRRLAGAIRERSAAPPVPEKPREPVDPEAWMRRFGLRDDPPPPRELESETDRWLREFGFTPDPDEHE